MHINFHENHRKARFILGFQYNFPFFQWHFLLLVYPVKFYCACKSRNKYASIKT